MYGTAHAVLFQTSTEDVPVSMNEHPAADDSPSEELLRRRVRGWGYSRYITLTYVIVFDSTPTTLRLNRATKTPDWFGSTTLSIFDSKKLGRFHSVLIVPMLVVYIARKTAAGMAWHVNVVQGRRTVAELIEVL